MRGFGFARQGQPRPEDPTIRANIQRDRALFQAWDYAFRKRRGRYKIKADVPGLCVQIHRLSIEA